MSSYAKRRMLYKLAVSRLERIRLLASVSHIDKHQMSLTALYAAVEGINQEIGNILHDVHAMGEWE